MIQYVTADMQISLQPLASWCVEDDDDDLRYVRTRFNTVIIIINNDVALTSSLHYYITCIHYTLTHSINTRLGSPKTSVNRTELTDAHPNTRSGSVWKPLASL